MIRHLLVEAAQVASRFDPELRRDYLRLKFRRGISGVAKGRPSLGVRHLLETAAIETMDPVVGDREITDRRLAAD